MQREWIGIDVSPQAATIMKRRVDSFGANATVTNLPMSIEELKQLSHFKFQEWVVSFVNGVQRQRKSGDLGIDGYSFLERHPIQVKQSESVGRNAVDNFETAIERDGKEVGYLVAFSFTKDAYSEAARSREVRKSSVYLVCVSDLLELQDLILAAKAARREPDITQLPVDLMGLFKGALAERRKRPVRLTTSLPELAANTKKRKRSQLQIESEIQTPTDL
jgi:Restriction endonuclease